MTRWTTAAFSLGALALVGGCGGGLLAPAAEGYDGRWAGRVLFSIGAADCPRRGAMTVAVGRGVLEGQLRFPDRDPRAVVGRIAEGGALEAGQLKLGPVEWATLTGAFEDASASGRYDSGDCEGTWELRRATREAG